MMRAETKDGKLEVGLRLGEIKILDSGDWLSHETECMRDYGVSRFIIEVDKKPDIDNYGFVQHGTTLKINVAKPWYGMRTMHVHRKPKENADNNKEVAVLDFDLSRMPPKPAS